MLKEDMLMAIALPVQGWIPLPVEEMEPYSVETCQYGYTVNKGEDILATYNDEKHPHAKAAAQAECDRLNAEYRKEQNNG